MKALRLSIMLSVFLGACAPGNLKSTHPKGASIPDPTNLPGAKDLTVNVLYSNFKVPQVNELQTFTRSQLGAGAKLGSLTVFCAEGLEQNGVELWITDGTQAGTKLLKDINPGRGHSLPDNFVTHGRFVYFVADDGVVGRELWKTDGTAAGTKLVKDLAPATINSSIRYLTSAGDTLYFTGNDNVVGLELWKVDAQDKVTLVKDINPGQNSSSPANLTVATDSNGEKSLYFSAFDTASGFEPWKSQGDDESTVRLADVYPGGTSSNPAWFTQLGSNVYFSASNGTSGKELYRTNVKTTTIVNNREWFDVNPGTGSAEVSQLTLFENKIYFTATTSALGYELWETNGDIAGTKPVADTVVGTGSSSPTNLKVLAEKLFMSCSKDSAVIEPCVLNSAKNGIDLVKELTPGTNFYAAPVFLEAVGDKVVFTANDGIRGVELWVTDGTSDGTELLIDVMPGDYGSSPARALLIAKNKLLIAASDTYGIRLWQTDGTPDGTSLFTYSNRRPLADGAFVGDTFFLSGRTTRTGSALWRTDGTKSGTRLVHEVMSSTDRAFMHSFSVANNGSFYFGVNDPAGTQGSIWKSDGSTGGTVKAALNNIQRKALSTVRNGTDFITVGDRLIFFSSDIAGGSTTLMATSGTRESNATLATISYYPLRALAHFGDKTYTSCAGVNVGMELCAINDGDSTPTLYSDIIPGTTGANVQAITSTSKGIFFISNYGSATPLDYGLMTGYDTLVKSLGSDVSLYREKFFTAGDKMNFYILRSGVFELWQSDGTAEGTSALAWPNGDGPNIVAASDIVQLNGLSYFIAALRDGDTKLYRINAKKTIEAVGAYPDGLLADLGSVRIIGDKLFFNADDGEHGFELFWTDGTSLGSADLQKGKAGSYAYVHGKNSNFLILSADLGDGMTYISIPLSEL